MSDPRPTTDAATPAAAAHASFAPEDCHYPLLDSLPRALGLPHFRRLLQHAAPMDDLAGLFAAWQEAAREKLRSLVLGALDDPEGADLNVRVAYERDQTLPDGTPYREVRFVFTSEPNADVPCHLLLPIKGGTPAPLAICLQGHSTGMHISLGRALRENDQAIISGGDRDFALQAVGRGYAALALEMRAFGEREPRPPHGKRGVDPRCQQASLNAFLVGRTLIGERVWDVSRAIDAVAEAFGGRVDTGRVLCMGNSGGGTVTYYAAALDERIMAAMPSCSVCTYKDSIGRIPHCIDNYLPGIGRWFEMGDVAVLIAPRPLVVVAGREDPIFPIAGVEEAYATVQDIYTAAGVPDRCRLVIGEGGHRFYAADAWPVLADLTT
jgi:dienelactone hydrolase